ncbi:hypothetical protein RHMOL_Rhmol07G0227900 [Rhododendron molle]|uniref:Uncharacterized protein n=1 Tax=Rhododendron molle TaxID=49168 RepID=A0ACC0N5C2_RHOML|nr:hypothetical protein RHMOL_Rhmol07G0227900 [Rhododendron molle]
MYNIVFCFLNSWNHRGRGDGRQYLSGLNWKSWNFCGVPTLSPPSSHPLPFLLSPYLMASTLARLESQSDAPTEDDLSLRFKSFTLTEEEQGAVILSHEDVVDSLAECQTSLLGKVISQKAPNLVGLRNTLGQRPVGSGSVEFQKAGILFSESGESLAGNQESDFRAEISKSCSIRKGRINFSNSIEDNSAHQEMLTEAYIAERSVEVNPNPVSKWKWDQLTPEMDQIIKKFPYQGPRPTAQSCPNIYPLLQITLLTHTLPYLSLLLYPIHRPT